MHCKFAVQELTAQNADTSTLSVTTCSKVTILFCFGSVNDALSYDFSCYISKTSGLFVWLPLMYFRIMWSIKTDRCLGANTQLASKQH